MIYVHPASDLTAQTGAAINKATGEWVHYKISPMP